MKHGKKLLSAIALTLCATTLIACANSNDDVMFRKYWLEDVDVTPSTVLETLEYDVAFDEDSGLNENYTVDYKNGKYTTKLTLSEGVYCYETSLNIDVIYTAGNQTLEKHDTVVTSVKFKETANLQPISSHKEIICHSPSNGGSTLETCFVAYNYTVDTTYNENGLGGTSVIVNNDPEADNTPQTQTFTVESKYTYLDNEQLLFALRGLSQSTTSASVSVYAPFSGVVQSINLTYDSLQKGTEFTFMKGETQIKQVINYYPVSMKINTQLSGTTQTVWIAEMTNAKSNAFRNVILQLKTPLSYNLGSLIYTLKSANFI